MRCLNGFNLLELTISVALILILLLTGIPTLQETLIQARINNQVYNLSQDILLSRNHAIQFETQVVLCHISNSGECDNNWSDGYSIFIDEDRNQIYQAETDKMILIRDYHSYSDLITFSGGDNIRYDADGTLNGLSGTFRACPDNDNEEDYARAVIISLSGRPKLSHDLDGDGKDEIYHNNDHISCSS